MGKFLRFSLLIIVMTVATRAYGQSGSGEQSNSQASTANATAKAVDLGQLNGGNYINNFFGLSLSVPQTWVDGSAQRRDAIAEETKRLLTTSDPAKRAQIEESIGRSTVLVSLTKLRAGEPGNASFMLIAERIPLSSIKTGADVIRTMKNAMTGTNFNIEFQGEARTEQIGGTDFSSVTVKNNSPYGTFMQRIYVTTKNGYSLQLFYTYLDDSDLAAFDSIIKTIRVK